MAKINAGLACPLCDQAGVTSELYQNTPSLAVLCASGNTAHKWTDIGVLRAANPRKLATQPRAETIQPNHVSLTLKVPAQTEQALQAKYGDRLSNNLAAVLQAFAEGDMMIINASDLERITQRTGFKVTSSSELFGRIFAMGEQIKELTNDVERMKRTVAVRSRKSNESVILDLGDQLPKAVAKAEESGAELEEFLSDYMRMSLENDWITATA